MRLDIKPLSINAAFKGRRFKTDKYKDYERAVLAMLPKMTVPEGYLSLTLRFGFSSKNADIDNPVKLVCDILQKKYGFNDRLIKRLVVDVEHVAKGKEFIDWEIEAL
jgi:Holliday junction resolvase RusA-like endonuclease